MPLHLTEAQLNEPVTAYARADFATLYPQWTVNEALAHMRQHPPPGRIIYFYVVDEHMKLVGVVPTRRLLLAQPETAVRDIMIKGVIAIPNSASLLEACEFFTLHRLLAFPIVDELKRLAGVIDIEAYAEELAETGQAEAPAATSRDEVFQLIGVRLTQSQQARPLVAFRGRFPWLLCNVFGGTLAAVLTEVYQVELNWRAAVLALFIPVVLALSESVAIQSLTLALDAFRDGRTKWADLLKKLRPEFGTGLLLGLSTGLLVGAIAALWQGIAVLFAVVAGGILVGVTGAALVGMVVPSALRILKLNPQVAAGPIALTCADVIALLAYFNLARLLTP